jgi:hypothetical protein
MIPFLSGFGLDGFHCICILSCNCVILGPNIKKDNIRGRECSAEKSFVLIVLKDALCPRSYCFLPSRCNSQVPEKC